MKPGVAAAQATPADHPFRIDVRVVLSDCMHCVWTLPEGDMGHSGRMAAIKGRFSRIMPKGRLRASDFLRREKAIWLRRFREHPVRGDEAFAAWARYGRVDPVKHGLAAHPSEWPYASWHPDGGGAVS